MEQETVICGECGGQTPTGAMYCSVCGLPIKEDSKGKKHLIFPIIAVGALLALGVAYAVLSLTMTPEQFGNTGVLLLYGAMAVLYGSLLFASIVPVGRESIVCDGTRNPMFPAVCVVTGEPATEEHVLTHFIFNFYSMRKFQASLPFSKEGWALYRKSTPVSLRIFKGGINVCMHVWLLGGYLSAYVWSPVMGLLCGLGALIELFFGKRQLVVPTAVKTHADSIVSFSVKGVHKKFAAAFLERP